MNHQVAMLLAIRQKNVIGEGRNGQERPEFHEFAMQMCGFCSIDNPRRFNFASCTPYRMMERWNMLAFPNLGPGKVSGAMVNLKGVIEKRRKKDTPGVIAGWKMGGQVE